MSGRFDSQLQHGHGVTSLTMGEEVEEVQKSAEGGGILKPRQVRSHGSTSSSLRSRSPSNSPLLLLLLLLLGSSTAAREVCWRQQAHGFYTPQLFGRGVNNTWKRRRKAGKIRGEAGHTLKEWPVCVYTHNSCWAFAVQTFDNLNISVGVNGIQKPVNLELHDSRGWLA